MYFQNRKRDVYNSNHVVHSWNTRNYRRFRPKAGQSCKMSATHLRDRKSTFSSCRFPPRLPSTFLVSPCLYFFSLPFYASLSFSLSVALHFYLFPGFPPYLSLPIAFSIAHPRASVHYRKYWISIMKYWMISDIRRAADIVRNQYVLAFLAVPTLGSWAGRGTEGRKLLCLW